MLVTAAPLLLYLHGDACDVQGDEVDANISEVQKIQIKRYKLEKWAYEPFFEKTVVGCIVRVAYSGKYHVAEVLEVQERETGRHRQALLLQLLQCHTKHNWHMWHRHTGVDSQAVEHACHLSVPFLPLLLTQVCCCYAPDMSRANSWPIHQ